MSNPDICIPYNEMTVPDLYTKLDSIAPDNNKESEMLKCLQERVKKEDAELNNLLNNYEKNKLHAITASELNRNTSSLYKTDLYYTIGKSLLFVCLITTYFYFFRITGIIEPLKNISKKISEKVNKLTEVKVPKIKLPEVTMPTIKMPEAEIVKDTNKTKSPI